MVRAIRGLIENYLIIPCFHRWKTEVRLNPLFKVTGWLSVQSYISCHPDQWAVLFPHVLGNILPPIMVTIAIFKDGAILMFLLDDFLFKLPNQSMTYVLFSPPFSTKGTWGTESLSNFGKSLPPEPHHTLILNHYITVDFSRWRAFLYSIFNML